MTKFNYSIFFGSLFQLRDIAHLHHLKSNSYSEHIALEEFYTSLLPLIDNIIETYQGATKELIDITIPETKMINHLPDMLQKLSLYYPKIKENFTLDIQNYLDELTALTNKTIYKLKFLK